MRQNLKQYPFQHRYNSNDAPVFNFSLARPEEDTEFTMLCHPYNPCDLACMNIKYGDSFKIAVQELIDYLHNLSETKTLNIVVYCSISNSAFFYFHKHDMVKVIAAINDFLEPYGTYQKPDVEQLKTM